MQTGILAPELKSIEQLFSGDMVLSVPTYQRSFAWGSDEIEELWEDILLTMNRESEYFLGTIVLQKKSSNQQEIIDGQQRIACLSMIFSAIRNVFKAAGDARSEQIFLEFLGARGYEKDEPPKPNLRLNRINNEFFEEYVIQSQDLADVLVALKKKGIHKSNKLLLQAYRYYLELVSNEASKLGTKSDSFIVPLINTLRSFIKFIAIPVASEEDANLFFESLNARGKELAVSDLVKNRLYYEANPQVKKAQALWENMENEMISKSIPEYLRHFWIAKKADEQHLNVREKKLYRAIAKDVSGNRTATLRLLRDLSDSARDYVRISDYSLWPDENPYGSQFEDSLNSLALFRVTQCHPLLLNAIQSFGTPKLIARAFRIVSNFSFRYFVIGNQSPGNLERESGRIAYLIRSAEITKPSEIASAFRSINPDRSFKADFALASISRSRSRIARHVLAKISNYLSKSKDAAGSELVANPDAREVNLEHILPQNFDETWHAGFSKDTDPSDYVYRIGNLTLLTSKINTAISNSPFEIKKEKAFSISKLPINVHLMEKSQWGEKEIDQRQEQMAKVALQVWKL
jgi:uncharacterized protein with ParB-like and HNH nuclease domain